MKFFRTIIKVKEIDSTMDFAKSLAPFVSRPFLIIADTQKKGRGQHKRRWESQKGGLWTTLCFDVKQPLGLSTYISIPVLRTIKSFLEDKNIFIKWPNDIFLEGKKVAGILVELKDYTSFVGIGINVKNKIPRDLSNIAVSMSEFSKVDLNLISNTLLKNIENTIEIFLNSGFSVFKKEYKENLMLLGKRVKIQKDEKIISGTVKDISDNGELILIAQGKDLQITYGSIIKFN